MKEKLKRFFIEKKELLIFVGILTVVFASVILIASLTLKDNKKDDVDVVQPTPSVIVTDPQQDPIDVVATFALPVNDQAKLLRNYYDPSKEESILETAIIVCGTHYIESTGVTYANTDDSKINVYAIYDGTVSKIEESATYGKVITIKHNDAIVSVYSSIETVKVNEGDSVKKGALLGIGGQNALDTESSNHMMLEVKVNGSYIDPLNIYNKSLAEAAALVTTKK